MNKMYFVLDENGNVKEVHDVRIWATWFETHQKEKILIQEQVGPAWVSTVFLGLNHAFGDGPPLIFETMVFDSTEETRNEPVVLGKPAPQWTEEEMYRYSTREEALAGHAKVVEKLKYLFATAEDEINE